MPKKCKKDFKKLGGVCVPNGKHMKRTTKKLPRLLKLVLIATFISIGGWSVWKALVTLTGVENISPWFQLLIGLGIISAASYFGWKRL